MRISRIDIYNADESFSKYAKEEMSGDYLGIIPRDSIFFFPEGNIGRAILADNPEVAAVSIFRNGLTSISIKAHARAPLARWCGPAPDDDAEEYCYVFDAGGFIFGIAASTTQTINGFKLYAPLDGGVPALRATIANVDKLPAAFDLARQLDTLGSPVAYIVLRGDEADDYLISGTRVTYVLGKEQSAFTALVSARDIFNLADGSIDYIDLRFDGNVYVKRR